MRFTPKTEVELQEEGLLAEDKYHFEIVDAKDKVSKSGNEMIELKLKIVGTQKIIFDYLLESMGFKLKHFADSANLGNKYQDGSLMANDCIGKQGWVHIVISPAKDGYPAKNTVKDYIVPDNLENSSRLEPVKNDFIDDLLPF